MENEKPESVLDICQKIRDAGILGLADHLEAAWKHDREALEAHVRSLQSQLKVAYSCGEQPPGNSAAMREALVAIRKALLLDSGTGPTTPFHIEVDRLTQAALSAPARNCDRDLSDRQAIWEEFCQWVRSSSLGCVSDPSAGDAFEWLLAPAAERKGEGDA